MEEKITLSEATESARLTLTEALKLTEFAEDIVQAAHKDLVESEGGDTELGLVLKEFGATARNCIFLGKSYLAGDYLKASKEAAS